ncbi:reverse transcriptase domain-containing protein [Tanacetum coccineum]
MEKIFQIFQDLHFDISFADALLLMPKFAFTFKSLLTNKDKLFELAKIPLNENCSAMLLKKLPKKLGDPGKFLIPCDFSGIDVCHTLADLGASINLMPFSIWKKLSLSELTPTWMTLELADRSITRPKGVAEDVFVKVRKFHFPTDFVVVDFEADPRVPLILGRSFLRIGRTLINVYEGELILRDGDEQLIFHVDSTSKLPQNYANESINMINFFNVTCDDSFEEVLRLKKSNHPSSGSTTPLSDSHRNEDVDFEADLREIELLLNRDLSTDFSPKITIDPNPERFINEPALVCLPPPGDDDDDKGFYSNPLFEFDDNYNPSKINPLFNEMLEDVESKDSNVSNFDEPVLLNTPLFNEDECFDPKGDIDEIDAFLDDYKDSGDDVLEILHNTTHNIFPEVFFDHEPQCFKDEPKLGNMKHMVKVFDLRIWERTFSLSYVRLSSNDRHYLFFAIVIQILLTYPMNFLFSFGSEVPGLGIEGIVLGHKISKSGIEVDRAKVNVIAKLPHPTTVKARPMTHLLEKETPFVFSQDCIDAFETLKKKLTEAPILVVPDWNLPFELMCDASDFAIVFDACASLAPPIITDAHHTHDQKLVIRVNVPRKIFSRDENASKTYFKFVKSLMYGWVEAKALPTNDARVVVKFLKSFFARFGTPRAIISDRGTHFYNDKFAKVMSKYGVTHCLATAYHPQMSGQVEVSNRGLKRILESTVGENRTSWSDRLDDALWVFRTAFKTLIGCTPYKLMYGKSCHLPIELEHKAYWALKHVNFDLKTVGDHQKLQLNELNELRDQAYENSLIYKERMKKLYDSKIKNRIFNVGDRVLLFNSRLKIFSGKLKTRWSGPFTITKVFPYGTIELSQPDGPNFKVNGHCVKHYFGGDIPSKVVPDP